MIDCKTASVTVNVAFPETLPSEAVMVDVPLDSDCTRPVELIDATVVFDEFHVGARIA